VNNILQEIIVLIVALVFAAFTISRLIKTKRKHDAIDSVADARVIKVLSLGRGFDGKPQFAITYQVLIDDPFEILVTPTNTPIDMGTIVAIYYDSMDHNNYYLPVKWKVDDRMKKAWTLVVIALLVVVGSVTTLFT
jgi:hypothetical protein